MKRFGSIALCIILILGMTSPAFAAEDSTHSPLEEITQDSSVVQDYVTKWRDKIAKDPDGTREIVIRDYTTRKGILLPEPEWKKFIDYWVAHTETVADDLFDWIDESTGDVVVPASVGQEIFNIYNSYIQNEYGFAVYPANKYTPADYLNYLKSTGFQFNYNSISTVLTSDYDFTFFLPADPDVFFPSQSCYIVLDLHPSGYRDGYVRFNFYDSSLNNFNLSKYYRNTFTVSWSSSFITDKWQLGDFSFPSTNKTYYYYLYLKNDTKIFFSTESLSNYLLGNSNVYYLSGLNERVSDLNVSINSLSLDYQKYTEDALVKLLKAIEDKKTELNVDTLTEKQLQDIIDDSVGSSLDELNQTLEDMANQNAEDNAKIITLLQLMNTQLKKWDDSFFKEFKQGPSLEDLKQLFAVDEDLLDAPSSIMQQLNLEVHSIPEKILNGLDAHLDAALNRFFDDKLEPLLRELIVPDPDNLDYTMSNIEMNLPFIGVGREFADFCQESFSSPLVPVISFGSSSDDADDDQQISTFAHNSGGGSIDEGVHDPILSGGIVASNLGTSSLDFDFSWFEPYRIPVQRVIAGFMWIYLAWSIYHQLPRIIDGSAEFIAKKEGW